MKKYISFIIGVLLAVGFYGCSEDAWDDKNAYGKEGNSLPVEFVMEFPGMEGESHNAAARSDKARFENGDAIHLLASFTLNTEEVQTVYACLIYNNGEWTTTEGSGEAPMSWPWNATKATFTAYYASHLNGVLNANSMSGLGMLGDIEADADPLVATAEDIAYGYAVPLTFRSLCAKLTFRGLNDDSDEFWLRKEGLHDAFGLERAMADDNASETLNFYFVNADEDNSEHFVAGARNEETGEVTFFVEPGDYSDIYINYPYDREYLWLKIGDLAELEANHAYTVQITEGSGEVINVEDEDKDWDNGDEVVLEEDVDINAFLQAIRDGSAYAYGDVPVLAEREDGGTMLLKHVSFNNSGTFTPVELPSQNHFDGNQFYIRDANKNIFTNINGIIENLGLEDCSVEAGSTTTIGVLGVECSGTLRNIRLRNISLSVTPTLLSLYDIGVLVGRSDYGTIDGVALGGNITVEAVSEAAPGRTNIGGLVGQSSGAITNVSMLNDESPLDFKVICRCEFEEEEGALRIDGDRSVGGIVGLSVGQISNCVVNVTVDANYSQAVLMYTGGLAGMVRSSDESNPNVTVSSCTISADVRGGLAFSLNQSVSGEGHSYTGGLIGYAYYIGAINDCTVMGKVRGQDVEGFSPWENAYYALGGAFGQTYGNMNLTHVEVWSTLTDLPAIADESAAKRYITGLFAGRAGRVWEGDLAAAGNVIHTSSATIPPIGEDNLLIIYDED